MSEQPENEKSENRDPITGERGSHPIGTGAGAAGGAVAGAAVGAGIGGPIGGAVGAVVGGAVGAYGGRGVAEAVNPTVEEAYWRENHAKQAYADASLNYEHYAPAYRTGFQSVSKYPGKLYEEVETDLALDYEKDKGNSALPWDRARPAVKAAWDRVSGVQTPRDPDRGARYGI
jgi:hypothetical protein